VQSAARRVADALRRSRYVVLLDGLEAYPWPPLVHHGEGSGRERLDQALLNQLEGFLTALHGRLGPTSGSRIVLGVDRSHTRSGERESAELTGKYADLVSRLTAAGWHRENLSTTATRRFAAAFGTPTAARPLVRADPPPADWGLAPDVWDLVWFTLSCVRRGRPLATVRRLLRPFVRGPRADRLVAALCAEGDGERLGFTRLEGGGLWYHRPVRNHVYAANSRGCGTAAMTRLLFPPPDADPAAQREEATLAAAQAALLAATHLRVSGVYYSNVYLQARDAVVFLEYTYHRQSGIRYLAKLVALLTAHPEAALAGVRRAGEYARTGAESTDGCLRLWEGLCPRAEMTAAPGEQDEAPLPAVALRQALTGEKGGREFARQLVAELFRRHAREIGALARAWVRAEPVLRVQLPAQQLVAWCAALVREQPSRFLDRVPVEPRSGQTTYPPGGGSLDPWVNKATDYLIEVVSDFEVKMLFDRADYALAATRRLDQLEGAWPPVVAALRRVLGGEEVEAGFVAIERLAARDVGQPATEPHDRLRHLHWLLDVAACVIKSRQEAGDEPQRAVNVMRVIDLVRHQVEGSEGVAADDADIREAQLRWHYFRAEAALGDVSVFTQPIGFLGRPPQDLPPDSLRQFLEAMDAAEHHVNLGMAAMRAAPPRTDGRLRSLMLDPIDGGWLYLPYRSAFHTVQGRLRWMRAARTPGIGHDGLREGFRTAFECFDLARGGLDGNHQIAALNELFLVEACLARGRLLLYPTDQTDVETTTDRLQQASAKYEAARTGLQTARKHLLTGRRNVIWWKLFYALAAQYHADRLLSGVARLVCEPDVSGTVGLWEVVARLRRGYQTVRAGRDLRPTADPAGDRGWEWLGRAWAEMTAAAYLTGRALLARATRSKALPVAHEAVVNVLRGLNTASRLDETDIHGFTASAEWTDKMTWYERLFADGNRPERALFLRLNVLRRSLRRTNEAVWNMKDLQEADKRAIDAPPVP
jgi:hypothetical protein